MAPLHAMQQLFPCSNTYRLNMLHQFQDDLYGITFIQKSARAPTIISLFLAITQVLKAVLDKLRQLYDGRIKEDHLLYLCIAEDRINVS